MLHRKTVLSAVLAVALLGYAKQASAMGEGIKPVYEVKRAAGTPAPEDKWNSAMWRRAHTLKVRHFMTEEKNQMKESGYRPDARARVLYNDEGLYVHFRVRDRYVRCIETEYHGKVWEDAAVEFFVQPKPDRGYFNFEINCGGTMLLSYHENPAYRDPAPKKDESVPWELASSVVIYHSLPEVVDPEIAEPVTWQIEYFIPFKLLEEYVGPLGDVGGQQWRANFYKIAENNSHLHYGAWSPILEGNSFHSPQFFGILRFATNSGCSCTKP